MLFNSLEFLVFFTIVVLLHFTIPHRFRWMLLLIASYYFYMSVKLEYGILLFLSTLIGYFCSLFMEKSENPRTRKTLLLFGLFGNFGMLFAFKYANFFGESLRELFSHIGIQFSPLALNLILPVGISFYTFQAVSYNIDVYRKKITAERHFGIYAVYHAFFPQLVAGPIERAGHLLPQFYEEKKWDNSRIFGSLQLIALGFFKKVVIADRLSLLTVTVFSSPSSYNGMELLLAAFAFTIQIYCDFSGYSDIARGTAGIMGYSLVQNFRRPFFAQSIAELWNRWHISLTKWFQDYVFIPLYLLLKETSREFVQDAKILHTLAFTLCLFIGWPLLGLWHGASWNFIIYGWCMALLIFLYYFARKQWDTMPQLLKVIATFLLFSLSNILFRSNSLGDAYYIFTHLLSGWSLSVGGTFIGLSWYGLAISFGTITLLLFWEWLEEKDMLHEDSLSKGSLVVKWSVSALAILFILLFGVFEKTPFIYFQF